MTHPTKDNVEFLCQQEGVQLLTYIPSPDEGYSHPFIPVAIVTEHTLPNRRCGEPTHNLLTLHKIMWFDETYTYYFLDHESTENQKFLMPRSWNKDKS